MANPWDKFYWNDWENDPALKLCSLAAQGLWMRCLCLCAKSEPKGYLLVAGRSLTPAELGILVGVSERETEMLLAELSLKGVFSRDRQGRIYSRRMLRDEQKSAVARQNGRLGGNPSLSNNTGISASDNPQLMASLNTHKPEAISQKSPVRTKPAQRRLSYSAAFEAFWANYPTDKLMSKKQAWEAWGRISDEDREAVMVSLPAFRMHCAQHPDYRPVHAVRYLSQRRFDGFAELAERTRALVYVRLGTPQWAAWERHYRETRGMTPPVDASGKGWRFPTEYPPGLTVVNAGGAVGH